jgi:hypothetical protein
MCPAIGRTLPIIPTVTAMGTSPRPKTLATPTPPCKAQGYAQGYALFAAGYYWEAHEDWETLWNAVGRQGPMADLLKVLIQIAAAGVKRRQLKPEVAERLLDRARNHLNALEGENIGALKRWLASPEMASLDLMDPAAPVQTVFETPLPR